MNGLGSLVNAFYDRFLLRDLFGKAVPGSVVLLTVATEGKWEYLGDTLWQLTELDLATQLPLLGMAWVVGLAVQELSHGLASSCSLFSWIGTRLWPERYDCNKKRYTLRRQVKTEGWEGNEENQQPKAPDAERAVVLKESTGNTSMALVISVVTVLLYGWFGEGVPKGTVIALVASALLLGYASKVYRGRQFDYWELLAGGEPSCTTGSD